MKYLRFIALLLTATISLAAAGDGPGKPAAVPAGRAGLDWWSLRPLRAVQPPAIQSPKTKSQNPLDLFIRAKLRAKGLDFARPADRRTLIRRVTFDLTGLPPTPAEIDAFVRDRSPNAYEKLVDRLLASSQYGERWARHWLDVARFGESHGFERDQFRPNAWRYRDYVIDSLNADKPYYQFVREQIAGDVLAPRAPDGIAATGFLVASPWDEVGATQASTVMKARVREEELEELIGAVSQTFLGLTANCARCHDHKFDPIPREDYYRLKAVFEGVGRGDRTILTPDQQKQREEQVRRLRSELDGLEERASLLEAAARRRIGADRNSRSGEPPVAPMSRWTFDTGPEDIAGGLGGSLEGSARVSGGRLLLDGKGAFLRSSPIRRDLREKTLEAWVAIAERSQGGGAAISVQTRGGGQFDAIVYGERQPAKWTAGSEGFRRTLDLAAAPESARASELIHVAVVYGGDNRISIYRNGRLYAAPYVPAAGAALTTFPGGHAEVLIGLRHSGAGNGFLRGEIEEARLYDRALTSEEIAASFRAGVENFTESELRSAMTDPERAEYRQTLERAAAKRREMDTASRPEVAFAVVPTQPKPTHVLERGDPESAGEVVSAAPLACVPGPAKRAALAPDAPEAERRRMLADWIADPRNPLTARVIVNRVWHHHFGRGIVGSPNDFGYSGERPSHPELLDWLAMQFSGKMRGSLKQLHRLIVLSQTYRQSAAYSAKAARVDAENRLLWRWSPLRIEAEAVRDAMLAVSGQLNPQRGGPSFQPFKVVVDNSHFYHQFDSGEPVYNRRSIYRASVHSAKSKLLETLDCPDPSTKTPKRTVTTTPLQALALMNDSFVLRQAREMAKRLEREAGPPMGARVALAYRLAFGREPNVEETRHAAAFATRSGLPELCWALLNATEFLYVR